MPLSVLHVSMPVEAGVAAYVSAAVADQVRRGWRVTVAAPPHGPLRDRLAALGVTHLAWEAARSPGVSAIGEAVALRRIVRHVDPDVVHLHSAKAGLVGRLVLRGRRPTVYQPHGWSWLACQGAMTRAAIAWERLAARWTAAVVCVGDGEADAGRAQGLSARVVRNGVDLERFVPADEDDRLRARAALGLPEHGRLALCVGRVTRQKGQDTLLRAWPRVLGTCPDALLVLVGDGELRAELEDEAPAGVLFAGARADVRPWYAACDVVVMPSRWEGLPLTALEAMACARPVVAFDVPGLREVVSEESGALVTAGDLDGLTHALAVRLLDPSLAWREGQLAALGSKEFDARATMEALARLTAEVAGRG
ncbi:glycosyltransferase [Nonomuraea typhae]|uniref:glycosyltransferase n=1 Tax=Nonomuraea typhae TaxID=2603600 RepID=UPI0012F775BB|nr:glycosyltransferase [Nonomuraea typhae]